MPHKYKDLTLEKFGRLQPIEKIKRPCDYPKGTYWLCECDCGKEVITTKKALESKNKKSCGCLAKEWEVKNQEAKVRHLPEYKSLHNMTRRCCSNKPKNKYYKDNFEVCARWRGRDGFKNFYADLGPKPTPEHSIDRIDNTKGYYPENCKWSTPSEQANNRRTSRLVTCDGETMTLTQWSRKLNISYHKLDYGLKTKTLEEIIKETL